MRISVIIPTFNRIDTLGRALRSVLAQTFAPYEVIVVDDGSTDGSGDFIKREFPTVMYRFQENKGVSAARNQGMEMASGEWFAFLDSDDEWLPQKLARQRDLINKNPDHKLCHTEEIWIRNGRRVNPKTRYQKSGGWIYEKCLPLCVISPSSVLLERSLITEVGGFDESLTACEDYDLWLRICSREPVLFIEEAMMKKYGGHSDQLSTTVWGLDRFRIRALEKILASKTLNLKNEQATREMLITKLGIFISGAEKRGNTAA